MKLEKTLIVMLNNYLEEKKKDFKDNRFNEFFMNQFPNILYEELDIEKDKYLIMASLGKENWTSIPWISIFDKGINQSARKGVYIAILFREDMSGFYLTLMQGYNWYKQQYGKRDAIVNIEFVNEKIRKLLGVEKQEILLNSELDYVKELEKSVITGKYYSKRETNEEFNIELASLREDIFKYREYLNQIQELIMGDYETFVQDLLEEKIEVGKRFSLASKKYEAVLEYRDDKFILKKGCYINKPFINFERYNPSYYKAALEVYENKIDEQRILLEDLEFTNPTKPATIVMGRNVDGYRAWVDENGLSMKDYFSSKKEEKKIVWEEFWDFYCDNKIKLERQNGYFEEYDRLREEFLKEYPLERIREFTLEDYCLGTKNFRESFSYKLEYGIYAKLGGSIEGIPAGKFGIYYGEGGYRTKDGIIENVLLFFEEFKERLYKYLKKLINDEDVSCDLEEYPLLLKMSSMITKLVNIYARNDFIDICTKNRLNSLIQRFGIVISKEMPTELLSKTLLKELRKGYSELSNDRIEYLNNALWKYLLFIQNKDDFDDLNDPKYWIFNMKNFDEYENQNIIVLGYDSIGDFLQYEDVYDVKEALESVYEDYRQGSTKNIAESIYSFVNYMKVSDIVYIRDDKNNIIARGKILSDYIYDEENFKYKNYRKIEWTKKREFDCPDVGGTSKIIMDISKKKEIIEEIEKNFDNVLRQNLYTKDDFFGEVVFDYEKYAEIINVLKRKKNIILCGVPGVGKTYCAKKIVYSFLGEIDDSRVVTVQFHPSYSYEDFVLGYRPTLDKSFKLQEGIFYKIVKDARRAYDEALNKEEALKYCIIIDEINRGNMAKIFGELLMLIEHDKRGREWSCQLAYGENEEPFYLPDNLYIIGTMNSVDRSLAMIDYALRRRFAFVELEPLFGDKKFFDYLSDKIDDNFVKLLVEKMENLNKYLEGQLGPGFVIGHSYFMNLNEAEDVKDLYREIITYEIKPLLEEYFIGDKEKVRKALEMIEMS